MDVLRERLILFLRETDQSDSKCKLPYDLDKASTSSIDMSPFLYALLEQKFGNRKVEELDELEINSLAKELTDILNMLENCEQIQ